MENDLNSGSPEIVEASYPTDATFKKFIPIVTSLICLACVILFAGFNLGGKATSWDAYRQWGSPSPEDLFNGDYWGLITSNFLHTEVWHIGFNLYWLWILGKKVEFETNKSYFGTLVLTSALVSSASEMAFASTTGIGLSGIVYSLFGFIFIKSRKSGPYEGYLNKQTVGLFFVWLLVGIILTRTKALAVGNAAHFGGFLWGMAMAYCSTLAKAKRYTIGGIVLLIVTSSIFWSPLSTAWLTHKAYQLYLNKKYVEATAVFNKILLREPGNEYATKNLVQLELPALQERAYQYHTNRNYPAARRLYVQILNIDSANEWARSNMNLLPDSTAAR